MFTEENAVDLHYVGTVVVTVGCRETYRSFEKHESL